MKKKTFIICPVREVSLDDSSALSVYRDDLQTDGHQVYYPAIDTDQTLTEYEICLANKKAIQEADEVHVWYRPNSLGSHFDLGVTFALDKPIHFINAHRTSDKSFQNMIMHWSTKQKSKTKI